MNDRGIVSVANIRVLYADTDAMKFVYHGKYLEYFEAARGELLRDIGIPYPEIEKSGVFIVVLEAHIHYKRPAQYDDVLHIKAIVNEMPAVRVRIDYEITRNDETEILITGYTIHTFLNATTNKPTRPPQKFIEAMSKFLN
jgi:acyl-CoA thioester hydrolase